MGAIFPEEATVYIGDVDINPSALVAASGTLDVTGEITSFSESGGEEDVDQIVVFGGGNLEKVKPRTQIEVSFDIAMQYDPDEGESTKWDGYKWGSGLTSAGNAPSKSVAITFTDGTNYYTRVYNNVKAITFEPETDAEDYLKGTITFKLNPTTSDGTENLKVSATALSDISDWGA